MLANSNSSMRVEPALALAQLALLEELPGPERELAADDVAR